MVQNYFDNGMMTNLIVVSLASPKDPKTLIEWGFLELYSSVRNILENVGDLKDIAIPFTILNLVKPEVLELAAPS